MSDGADPTSGGEAVALRLDCRGMRCPRPIIEIARRLAEVGEGELIELWADDPAAAPDLAAWCRMRHQQLVLTAPPRFLVRRCGSGSEAVDR